MRNSLALALLLLGCGSSSSANPGDAGTTDSGADGATTTLSGGAQLGLLSEGSASCPSVGEVLLVAERTSDGQLRLIADGENGAVVRCKRGETSFDASVSYNGVSVAVAGTIAGTKSTDAKVTVKTPSHTYQTTTTPCTIELRTETTPGRLGGTLRCPALTEGTASCATTDVGDPSTASFFRFTGCTAM